MHPHCVLRILEKNNLLVCISHTPSQETNCLISIYSYIQTPWSFSRSYMPVSFMFTGCGTQWVYGVGMEKEQGRRGRTSLTKSSLRKLETYE